ncbi:NAD(P)-dependent dehydrogenase (short-subunit alcohol dehydrogenase family) [Nakamurella sp. UYEF19]|uniref:SDR family NAD(P)-dependent oxidoreductase n=1 Tax=Nakamurella sp. UYEF19 TaxID=1756392 RepID=UPI00339360B8
MTTQHDFGLAPVVLITGANKGLGRETARRLVAENRTVFLTARHAERGREAADDIGARFLQLDVTDDESVHAAVEECRRSHRQLDVLVNNAANVGHLQTDTSDVTAEDVRAVYETNVLGLVRVTQAFLPLLRASSAPAIVNVSSGMGSLTRTADPSALESRWVSLAYASSKTAVNMLTLQYAKALPDVRINAVDPGLTATDGTGNMGKDVREGAQAAVRMALLGGAAPTGTFSDIDGLIPW